jgi:Cu(I)/Ag(I) efflux system protein CusF
MKRVIAGLAAAAAMAVFPIAEAQTKHAARGVVTAVDRPAGKVTIRHEPVKSLNWPGMTMGFAVKDKLLLDKLAKDSKVDFEFVVEGRNYVIISIK